ncbi:MAG: hypothetical protein U0795_09980 [Pirellulales bacterium]
MSSNFRTTTGPGSPQLQRWSLRGKLIASCFLAVHVLALVVGPWSGPPPASQLSAAVAGHLSPYLFALHLNHGYRFFAPNPGPSHLVRYELTMADGSTVKGQFPDPQQYRPRQLYHRHFMISESTYGLSERVLQVPVEPRAAEGELLPPGALEEYREFKVAYDRDRAKSDALVAGIARQLIARHQARSVKLWMVEHGIPIPDLVAEGMPLDDPSLYRERLLGEWNDQGQRIEQPLPAESPVATGQGGPAGGPPSEARDEVQP